jgi:hypothetical protein
LRFTRFIHDFQLDTRASDVASDLFELGVGNLRHFSAIEENSEDSSVDNS